MKRTIFAFMTLAAFTVLTAFVMPSSKENNGTSETVAEGLSKWTLDKIHSNVRFTVSHMIVAETEGTFKVFDGTVEHTKSDWSDAKIEFTVDVNSINTDNKYRDEHLISDDFFNAEKYPKMTFKSTSFTPLGNNNYELKGNLTIRDVTKPVKFDVKFGGIAIGSKTDKAGFKAITTINRFDYNLKWNKLTEAGGAMVGKDIEIAVRVELDRNK
jgi:polyisoprenoid-binding protein YceI